MTLNNKTILFDARGCWDSILSTLAPKLRLAIEKCPEHVPCPVHGGKDGLRAFDDFEETGGMICNTCGAFPNGLLALQWINNWNENETIHQVKQHLEGSEITMATSTRIRSNNQSINHSAALAIEEVIDESLPLYKDEAKSACLYLQNRGINISEYPGVLLYHPKLPYHSSNDEVTYHPALLGEIEKDGVVISLMRIFITNDGHKAHVETQKKMMTPRFKGATNGAAIQLYYPSSHLAVAEGIETAFAVFTSVHTPTWATVNTNGMKTLEVPRHVKRIDIWVDKDRNKAGEKAAHILAKRMHGEDKEVRMMIPSGPIEHGHKSIDWLDVLNQS
jgi:putative DNA primase/helicase